MELHDHVTLSTTRPHERFLKIDEVAKMVGGVSKPTVYKFMREHGFPQPYRLLPNRIAWSLHEILEWIELQKTAQRDEAA